MTDQTVPDSTDTDRLVKARAFAEGEIPASPDGMRLGREIVRDLLAEVKEISRELHAYKRAKQENDERFQLAASAACRERDEAVSLVEQLQGQLDKAERELDYQREYGEQLQMSIEGRSGHHMPEPDAEALGLGEEANDA